VDGLRGPELKKLLTAGIAAAAFYGAPALAADLPVKAPVFSAPVPFSWAGIYVGANGGYAWGRDRSEYGVPGATALTTALDPQGALGGVQVGYNAYFSPNWLLGYELDFSGGDIKASGLASDLTPANSKTDYFGTARARIGYAADHWLIYGTGGAAWTHNKFVESAPGTPGDSIFTRNQYYVGWVAGAGVEYAVDRNWSLKAEYLYANLGKEKDGTLPAGVSTVSRFTEQTLNVVRIGVNYRFDDSAPNAATSAYPVKASPVAVASAWSGNYVGANAGYGWGRFDAFDSVGLGGPQTISLNPAGGFGGFQTGYNWHFAPRWIVGLESEISFGSLSQSGFSTPSAFATNVKIQWIDTERARIGFLATNEMLIYGTGGVALAHDKLNEINGAGTTVMSLDQYRVGWTAGGGVEYAWSPQWSAKFEYLYSDVGGYRDTRSTNRTADLTLNTVKVGLNYHGSLLEILFGGH